MARRRDLQRAKKLFLEAAADRDWMLGVGMGMVDGTRGLVVYVTPKAKSAARRLANRLELNVPVQLRGVEEIRAQAPVTEPVAEPDADDVDMEQLRRIAAKRLRRS